MIEVAALVVFPMLMAFSAFSDLLTMTIPNRVSLALVVVFAVLAVSLQMPLAIVASHASCALAMLIATFVLFHFRLMGGGDAKLAAATALWLGWENLFDYWFVASLAGGVLTLAILELRRRELPTALSNSRFLTRLGDKSVGAPYGIALAVAGLSVYPQSGVWTRLAGG
ncbi:MAG: peptidase [Methylocystaceae bacterium]|nr:MAG: peptidase [Methylocystaceae bacterium]